MIHTDMRTVIKIAFALALTATRLLQRSPSRHFPHSSEQLLTSFRCDAQISRTDYDDLFRYFVEGWHAYSLPARHAAAYPGYPSRNGKKDDQMEGFARVMPLFAAWIQSGREGQVRLPSGALVTLEEELERGLLAGTDPSADTFWGPMTTEYQQRVVEAADIALALWMVKDTLWADLRQDQRDRVASWLMQINRCKGVDNNWHLFYVLVDRVLNALGYEKAIPSSRKRYLRVKEFYLGSGWFQDGPDGPVDYYNAWGFHYLLFWIHEVDASWDPGFIPECQRAFLSSYKHLIGPNGVPILGRSIPYRIAVSAPLVLGQRDHPDVVNPGMARRALDVTWRYFIQHGAVRNGAITQGYFDTDLRVLDVYSGPASSLWSLRSLIAAVYQSHSSTFWTSDSSPLPVERESYTHHIGEAGWRVHGDKQSAAIVVEVLDNAPDARPELQSLGLKDRIKMIAYQNGRYRPDNHDAKYGRRYYRSDVPFIVDSA